MEYLTLKFKEYSYSSEEHDNVDRNECNGLGHLAIEDPSLRPRGIQSYKESSDTLLKSSEREHIDC